ncbi:MAG: hypothetical protein CL489_06195 [Acidobacteria bacterium]|nr:hypothetical protein [Acidobacteriota bacterium]|tara:strand:- start:31407 stop:31823 length:417 start_codon:yes stop_codon:yes gene_type:complete
MRRIDDYVYLLREFETKFDCSLSLEFLQAWENYHELVEEKKFISHLRTLLRSRGIDAYRRRKKMQTNNDTEALGDIEELSRSAEEFLDQFDLDRLTVEERWAVSLRLQYYTYSEIGRLLELTPKQVRILFAELRRKFL